MEDNKKITLLRVLRVEVLPPISPRPLAHSAAGLRERKSITAIAVSAIQPMLHKFIIILQRREGRNKSIYFLYIHMRWAVAVACTAQSSQLFLAIQITSSASALLLHYCEVTVSSGN